MEATLATAAPTTSTAPTAALLRVMTCGSVDDGKSTLIGRLLHETQAIMEDQWAQLTSDSRRFGTQGAAIDFALLVDGLEAEREQGITIDVAYRFASTPRRRFIIADSPGHEQYTRNMATAASTADVAIVLVDARHGVLTQTNRHSFIASLMGIRHILLAVNKMDLVDFDQSVFDAIVSDYGRSVATAGFTNITAIPISAKGGDNVTALSPAMAWYVGPTLLGHLETLEIEKPSLAAPLRLPVQWVSRPNQNFRGYAGTIATGRVRPGDTVMASGSGQTARVARIVTMDGELDEAEADDAITLVLDREIDVSRGDVLTAEDVPEEPTDQFGAHLVWLTDAPLSPGRTYLLKLGTRTVSASVTRIRHRIDVNTRQKLQADQLTLNDVAKVNLSLSAPIAWTRYADSRDLGGFILIDRQTNVTAGVGMIDFALVRAANLRWQDLDTNRDARAALKGQRPAVLWFTGLSGAGKSTIANLVERRLYAMGRHTYVLDGDNVRHGLNRDLGFTEADRVENIRRVSEVAALFAEAGLLVIVAFISPYRAERDEARRRLPEGEFLEVFVDTPIEECAARDVKGLYRRAIAGEIRNFTGISAPYEPPLAPDIHLRTADGTAEVLAESVVEALRERGFLTPKGG
jgi:bifunctional enzyme CysN/CysC